MWPMQSEQYATPTTRRRCAATTCTRADAAMQKTVNLLTAGMRSDQAPDEVMIALAFDAFEAVAVS